MRPRTRLLTLLCLTVFLSGTIAAQDGSRPPIRGWTFGFTGFGVLWTHQDVDFDVTVGPAFQLGYVTPHGLGFDFRGELVLPTGFYDMNGVSGILGLSYSFPVGAHVLQLKAGVTWIAGGDSDGSHIAGGGGYAGVGAVLRLSGRLGIQGDLLARYLGPGVVPSAALGLVLLPK